MPTLAAALDRPAQGCAWLVERPQDWDRPKPEGLAAPGRAPGLIPSLSPLFR